MTPYQGFMADLLEQVAGEVGLTFDDLGVDWATGSVFVDPERETAPQRGPWMKTEAGWVQLSREGGPGE